MTGPVKSSNDCSPGTYDGNSIGSTNKRLPSRVFQVSSPGIICCKSIGTRTISLISEFCKLKYFLWIVLGMPQKKKWTYWLDPRNWPNNHSVFILFLEKVSLFPDIKLDWHKLSLNFEICFLTFYFMWSPYQTWRWFLQTCWFVVQGENFVFKKNFVVFQAQVEWNLS